MASRTTQQVARLYYSPLAHPSCCLYDLFYAFLNFLRFYCIRFIVFLLVLNRAGEENYCVLWYNICTVCTQHAGCRAMQRTCTTALLLSAIAIGCFNQQSMPSLCLMRHMFVQTVSYHIAFFR